MARRDMLGVWIADLRFLLASRADRGAITSVGLQIVSVYLHQHGVIDIAMVAC